MKRNAKTLSSFSLETQDHTKGKIKDLLFDEVQWVIRYVEADFGGFFEYKRVLVPRVFLESPDWEGRHFPISLRDSEINKCPDIQNHLPVSRKYEKELYNHYRISPYWPTINMGMSGGFFPPRPINIKGKELDEEDLDTILRSYKEVQGYHINALDGKLGHLEDIVIDVKNWQIIYAIVDTSNWLPWSKKVLIPLGSMDKINFVEREVHIRMNTEAIKNAPEYESADSISEDYEEKIMDFFSSSLVK